MEQSFGTLNFLKSDIVQPVSFALIMVPGSLEPLQTILNDLDLITLKERRRELDLMFLFNVFEG